MAEAFSPIFVIASLAVESINVLPSFSAILHAAPTTISPIAESSFRERPLFVLLEREASISRQTSPVVCERACTRWNDEDGMRLHVWVLHVRVPPMHACVCAKERKRTEREGEEARKREIVQRRGRERERKREGGFWWGGQNVLDEEGCITRAHGALPW